MKNVAISTAVTLLLCQLVTGRNLNSNIAPPENVGNDDIVLPEISEEENPEEEELSCRQQLMDGLNDIITEDHQEWIDETLERIERLLNIRLSCYKHQSIILQRQCLMAFERIRAVEIALITRELRETIGDEGIELLEGYMECRDGENRLI